MAKLEMSGQTDSSVVSFGLLSRREALKKGGWGVAAIALTGTGGVTLVPGRAQAQLVNATAGLQLVYRTSRLQQAFYTRAKAGTVYTGTALSATEKAIVDLLVQHKSGHVTALAEALGSETPAAINDGDYDLSGNDAWGTELAPTTVTSATSTDFYEAAQLLEDFAVRVQKAAIAEMLGHAALQTLFRMHSATGKHAAMIRLLRGRSIWVSGVSADGAYDGSQATLHTLVYGEATSDTTVASTSEDNLIQGTTLYSTPTATWYDEPIRITASSNDAADFLAAFDA